MEKISVIIPIYNSSRFINDCLRSIFNSTYRNFEVIVVDDGSTDDLSRVLGAVGEFRSDIVFLSTEHQGQAAARNLGFQKSTGEYAAFFDADDINGKMRFELCVKRLEENPGVGMVFCGSTFINEQGGFLPGVSKFPNFASEQFLGRMFEGNWISTISTTLFRSNVFKKTGGFDESFPLAEDYDLYLRTGKITRVKYVDLPLVRCRRHDNNLRRDWQTCKEYEIRAIKKHDPAEIASKLSIIFRNEEEFRVTFGKILYRIGHIRQAMQHFHKAYKINAMNEDVYFFTGNCYFDTGNYQKAGEEYGKCLAINPNHVGCLNNVGVLYFIRGEYERSIAEFEKAAKLGNNCLEPQYNLACIKNDYSGEKLLLSVFGMKQLQNGFNP
ncbi:hypothetical protein AMJ80_11115 [bacterium SM23_31]|nr:MAG: hypothetical protein AMJ80_11115 [bacterium SM23_31]